MAVCHPLYSVQPFKSDMANRTPLLAASNNRPNIINLAHSNFSHQPPYAISNIAFQNRYVTRHVPRATIQTDSTGSEEEPSGIHSLKYIYTELICANFEKWVNNLPSPLATIALILFRAFEGAVVGGAGKLFADHIMLPLLCSNPQEPLLVPGGFQPLADSFLEGSPVTVARNFAVLRGTSTIVLLVLRRLRGKQDVQASMMARFCAGVMVSLVTGMRGLNVIPFGIVLALMSYIKFIQSQKRKANEKFSSPQPEDLLYNETREMLSSLGFDEYEENFRYGLLTDKTLPLLTESALRDVEIPAGARLLILDHIQRFNNHQRNTASSDKYE